MQSSLEMYAMKVFKEKIVNDKNYTREYIGLATDLTGKTPEVFECQICLQLVYDPQECAFCNKIFCRLCIEKWAISNKSCPLCRK